MCDASIVQCARDVTFECSSIRVGCQRMRGRWNMNRHSDVHRVTTTTNDERRDRSIDRSMDERRSAKSRVSFIFFIHQSRARASFARVDRVDSNRSAIDSNPSTTVAIAIASRRRSNVTTRAKLASWMREKCVVRRRNR